MTMGGDPQDYEKPKKKKKTDWVGMTVPRVGEAVEKLAL